MVFGLGIKGQVSPGGRKSFQVKIILYIQTRRDKEENGGERWRKCRAWSGKGLAEGEPRGLCTCPQLFCLFHLGRLSLSQRGRLWGSALMGKGLLGSTGSGEDPASRSQRGCSFQRNGQSDERH